MQRISEAWFEFNGLNSRHMGIELVSMPIRGHPARRYTRRKVSSRSGTVRIGDGAYEDVSVKLECHAPDMGRMDEISAWLDGSGLLRFSDEQHLTYDASVERAYDRSSVAARFTAQKFTVVWTCDPRKRLYEPAKAYVFTQADKLLNPGTVFASPKVKIIGSGDFSLTIGAQTLFFTGITDGIVVDSEKMDALNLEENELLNDHVGGALFEIQPGLNDISWVLDEGASIESVEVTPRWRYI